jgi:hypothetical protein
MAVCAVIEAAVPGALGCKQMCNVRCVFYTSSASTERLLQTGNGDRRAAGAILRRETEEKVRPPVSGRAAVANAADRADKVQDHHSNTVFQSICRA